MLTLSLALHPMGWLCSAAYPLPKDPRKGTGKGIRKITKKGIRKITGLTLWDYDSTSLILELKPLNTAFDRATCSFIHTQTYTTKSITDSVAKGGVAIRVYKLSIALGTNTQSPNHNISKFNASIPFMQSNLQPYEHRHCATQPSLR